MATLVDYQNLDLYAQGECLTGDDFVLGYYLETWIKVLNYQESTPPTTTLTLASAAAADDTSITVDVAAGSVRVYERDVLYFPTDDVLVLILADAELTGAGNVLTVAALTGALTAAETADTYGMIPVLSAVDGGIFAATGTSALARTKAMGLNPARSLSERDGSLAISGQINVKDAAMFVMDDQSTRVNRFYVESRYAPFISFTNDQGAQITGGRGIGAKSGAYTFENFTPGVTRGEFITFDASFTQAGCVEKYKPLGAAA